MSDIDWDKPLQTRDGHEVVVHTTGGKDPEYPVIGELKRASGCWETANWSREGRWFTRNAGESKFDLINAPEKKYCAAASRHGILFWTPFSSEEKRSDWIAATDATVVHTWESAMPISPRARPVW